jgi:hypothetical protein
MLSLREARERALAQMRSRPVDLPRGDELVLVDDDTLEREWGWVFFFASRRWRETGDPAYHSEGEGPLIVNRFDGSVHVTGTGRPSEYYLTRYETEFRRDRDGWLLVLREIDPRSPAIREVLEQILDLRGDEVAELDRRLPAVVMEGPRTELVRACQDLLTAGARAEVRRV